MVKDHSDSERGNPLPSLHGLLFALDVGLHVKLIDLYCFVWEDRPRLILPIHIQRESSHKELSNSI